MPIDFAGPWKVAIRALSKRDPQHIVVIVLFFGLAAVASISNSVPIVSIVAISALAFLIIYLRWTVGEARKKDQLAEGRLTQKEAAAAQKRVRERIKAASRAASEPQLLPDLRAQPIEHIPKVKQPNGTPRAGKPRPEEDGSGK